MESHSGASTKLQRRVELSIKQKYSQQVKALRKAHLSPSMGAQSMQLTADVIKQFGEMLNMKSEEQIAREKFDQKITTNYQRSLKMHQILPKYLQNMTQPPVSYVRIPRIDVDREAEIVNQRFRKIQQKNKSGQHLEDSMDDSVSPSVSPQRQPSQVLSVMRQQSKKNVGFNDTTKSLLSLKTLKQQSTVTQSFKGVDRSELSSRRSSKQNSGQTTYVNSPRAKEKFINLILDDQPNRKYHIKKRVHSQYNADVYKGAQVNLNMDPQGATFCSQNALKERINAGIQSRINQAINFSVSQQKLARQKTENGKFMLQTDDEPVSSLLKIKSKRLKNAELMPKDRIVQVSDKKKRRQNSLNRSREGPIAHSHYVKMRYSQLPPELKIKVLENEQIKSQFLTKLKQKEYDMKRQRKSQKNSVSVTSLQKLNSAEPKSGHLNRQRNVSTDGSNEYGLHFIGAPRDRSKTSFHLDSSKRNSGQKLQEDSEEEYSKRQDEQPTELISFNEVNLNIKLKNRKLMQRAKHNTYANPSGENSLRKTTTNQDNNRDYVDDGDKLNYFKSTLKPMRSFVQSKNIGIKAALQKAPSCRSRFGQRQMSREDINQRIVDRIENIIEPSRQSNRKDRSGSCTRCSTARDRLISSRRSGPVPSSLTQSQLMRYKNPSDMSKVSIKRTSDSNFIVKQEFFYQEPKRFRYDFAQPAIFKTGCLTCGNDNAKIENYGDRHCCKNCQTLLQMPTGELVQLRLAQNGRKIKGVAMRNHKELKDVKVDIDDLRIRGNKCYATFSGERGEIIVLVSEVVKQH